MSKEATMWLGIAAGVFTITGAVLEAYGVPHTVLDSVVRTIMTVLGLH